MTIAPTRAGLAAVMAFILSAPAIAIDPYSAQPGAPDLHFGEWGLGVATLPGRSNDVASDFGTDSAGRIVVGGTVCEVPSQEGCFRVLMRFDQNGRRDHTGAWGDDAMVMLAPATTAGQSVKIAPAADNGWWAAWRDTGSGTWNIVKVAEDGSFVPGFVPGELQDEMPRDASSSMRLHNASDSTSTWLIEVVALAATDEETPVLLVTRRSADTGELDATFGADGRFMMPFEDGQGLVASEILPDGRILVLLADWSSNVSLLAISADGSGLAGDFGEGGRVDVGDRLWLPLLDEGVEASSYFVSGMGVAPGGNILVGLAVYDEAVAHERAMVAAFDLSGELANDFGNGKGYVLHPLESDLIFGFAFAVNPADGSSVMDVWTLLSAYDAMLYFTPDGNIDARYGDSPGTVLNLMLPDESLLSPTKLAYDVNGGVLALDAYGFGFSSILGLNGFGISRYLAPGETRVYDAEPDPVDDFTWPSAPLDVPLALMLWDFRTRDVAIEITSDANGRIGLSTHGGDDYSFLPRNVVLPVGVVANLFHRSAPTPGTYSETLFTAGSMAFTLGSITNVDDRADSLSFEALENVSANTFVFSGPDVISGIDVPIDIAVENGCYFLFNDFDEIPDDFNDWPGFLLPENCVSEPGTAVDGQIVFLAHVSAAAPVSETTTTFHYGDREAHFRSTTSAETLPVDREPDPFGIPSATDVEPGTVVVIGPIALSGFDTAFEAGDTLNESTARFEVSTDGETWAPTVDIGPGGSLWIRIRSAPSPATTLTGELYITSPDNRMTFTVTTKASSDLEEPEQPDEPNDPDDPEQPDDPNNPAGGAPDDENRADSGGGPFGLPFIALLAALCATARRLRVA